MWVYLVPGASAILAAGVAIGIALQNHRWSRADREEDRAAAARSVQVVAQRATARKASEEMYAFLPANCSNWIADATGDTRDLAIAVRAGMAAVEPLRTWAFVLPLPWRIRIDGLAVCIGHHFDPEGLAAEQLRRDLSDLLNGCEYPQPIHEDLVRKFITILQAMMYAERYSRDPATRHLADEFSHARVKEIVGALGHNDPVCTGCEPRALQLIGLVTGQQKLTPQLT